MIEVIKHGKKKQNECFNCGCIFTYEKEDVEIVDYGRNEVHSEVQCPDCGAKCQAVSLR